MSGSSGAPEPSLHAEENVIDMEVVSALDSAANGVMRAQEGLHNKSKGPIRMEALRELAWLAVTLRTLDETLRPLAEQALYKKRGWGRRETP